MSTAIKKTSRLKTIDSIVHNVLNDLGTYDHRMVLRYKQWAVRGLKALNMHVMPTIEVEYFTVNTNNFINLPDDYIHYTRIGVVRNGGRIWTLTKNNNIPISRDETNGTPINYTDLEDAENIPNTGTWFAAPPKVFNFAYHRYDKEFNRLIFSGDMAGESILVEYISTGINERGEVVVPTEAEEALIAWVHHQRAMNDPKATIDDKNRRDREFKRCVVDLVDFTNSFTLDDLRDTINAQSSQLPKR